MKILSESEMNFAQLIWEREPISSGQLVKLCAERFEWKKSTTYTVLKHLCQYGYFKNEDSIVSSCMTKEEYLARESSQFVEEKFEGSLSRFLAAFAGGKALTKKQRDEIREMIDRYED